MNESTDPAPPPLYARPHAIRLAFALLAGLTLLVGLAFFGRSHRGELETAVEVTAVGDQTFVTLPAQFPTAVAVLAGQPLYVLSPDKLTLRDTHMEKVGTDASSGLTVYKLGAAGTPEEQERVKKSRANYLLKIAPNEYAKVSETPAK